MRFIVTGFDTVGLVLKIMATESSEDTEKNAMIFVLSVSSVAEQKY